MRSDAATVGEYLESLPEDRRETVAAVRRLVLEHLPAGYEESMNWGMIAYEVPLAVCPDTYNGQPLAYAGLASQKRYVALYLSNVYAVPALREEFEAGFRAAGKKLDMGKSCVRFRRVDDLPLDTVARAIAATPMGEFVALAKSGRGARR